MFNIRSAICIVAGLSFACNHPLHAVLVDGYHLTGPVLADNFVIYTGSPSIDFAALEEGFLSSPNSLASASVDCPLKNRGDVNCDGDVDHDDLAFWASTLSPLTHEAESFASVQGNFGIDDIVTQASYLYIAAWTHPEDSIGDPGILADLTQGQPNGRGDLKSTKRRLPTTVADPQILWEVCSTEVMIDPANNSAPATDQISAAIAGCTWVKPTVVTPPIDNQRALGFDANAQRLWDGSAANDASRLSKVVLLRHPIDPLSSDLSIRIEDTGNLEDPLLVTVDPYLVREFKLTLQINQDQVRFDANAPNAATAVSPFNLDLANLQFDAARSRITDITGRLVGQQQLPMEVDVFTIALRKERALRPGEEYDLRIVTEGTDFVILDSPEPNIRDVRLEGFQVRQAATGAFTLDLDRDNVIGFGDIDVACTYGDPLTELLFATGTVIGDVDFDRRVTFADFLIATANFELGSLYSQGDVDCNGEVNLRDTQIIIANVGRGDAEAVSEPSANALVGLGWLILTMYVGRGRRPSGSAPHRSKS